MDPQNPCSDPLGAGAGAVLGASAFTTVISIVEAAGCTVLGFARRLSETVRMTRLGAVPIVMRGDLRTTNAGGAR